MTDQPHPAIQGKHILEVPRITASSFTVQSTGDDMIVLCHNVFPVVDPETHNVATDPVLLVTAVLVFSPGAARDLMVLLQRMVENHERTIGPISTRLGKQEPELVGGLYKPIDRLHRA
jgi:hypothetical protein